MQLSLDAADRLVELVEERRGPVVAEEAARRLFALRQAPVGLARSLLAEVVDTDARLALSGDAVSLARAMLYDPRWPWHAAAKLGARVAAPHQYWRSQPREYKDLFENATFGAR